MMGRRASGELDEITIRIARIQADHETDMFKLKLAEQKARTEAAEIYVEVARKADRVADLELAKFKSDPLLTGSN